jgi:hypothetical protein
MSDASPKAVNRLLAALPDAEYQRLLPHLNHVSLPLRQVVHEVGEPIEYVYFPIMQWFLVSPRWRMAQ